MEAGSSTTTAPEWFNRALSTPGESRSVEVEGCPIHYLRWGDPARPGLLFVPASGAHAHWFDHVAPFFSDQFNIVAIDLSGTGDSGHRATYSNELIAAEIMAVCEHAGMLAAAAPPTLVGHSAGVQFAFRTALANDKALLGVIGVDGLRYARLAKDHAIKVLSGERPAPRLPRVYADLAEPLARFRLRPEPLAPIDAPYILEHIARHSYRPVEGGWVAKADPAQSLTIGLAFELLDQLRDLSCHSAAIFCEHTHLADETASEIVTAASPRTVVFTIPGSTHYPLIDNPPAFVAAVKGVVLSWLSERTTSVG